MHPLSPLFSPRSIAVIGASHTRGKLGYVVLANLRSQGFTGTLYPVNPKAKRIQGLKTYASVQNISEGIDLAVILVPSAGVSTVLRECGNKRIPFAIIISAGFKEIGAEGAKREKEIQQIAREHNIRLLGPNCLGLINVFQHINASFSAEMPRKGNISLISQSGAMAVALLDWAHKSRLGFSHIISIGNKADIDEVDCLEYLAHDQETRVILMYTESIERGRAFMEAATRITPHTPIVLLHAGGNTTATQQAITSHTGALVGSREALIAACMTAGVQRVSTIKDFFDVGLVLSRSPMPRGNRIAILTNAGGPGIMAVDAFVGTTLTLALLPHHTKNPLDLLGDATPERYADALAGLCDAASADASALDGIIVILTPQAMTQPDEVAKRIVDQHRIHPDVPILASFIGGASVQHAREILEQHGIPHYSTPERAVAAMDMLVRQSQRRSHDVIEPTSAAAAAKQLPYDAHHIQIRTQEAETLLEQYGLPVMHSQLVTSRYQCASLKEFPIVMKIASRDIVHKAACGGVVLHLQTPTDAERAYEQITHAVHAAHPRAEQEGVLVQSDFSSGNSARPGDERYREVILGMKRDDTFGPVMLCGMGGTSVEVYADVTYGIAPLTRASAQQMIESIRGRRLLDGYDIRAAAKILVTLSTLSMEYPQIRSIDLNPVCIYRTGEAPGGGSVIVADVRILV